MKPRTLDPIYLLAVTILCGVVFGSARVHAALLYAEGTDLSNNFAIPTDLGTIATGISTVSGSINATCSITDCNSSDKTDAFQFSIPSFIEVYKVELTVANLFNNSSEGDYAGRYLSGTSGLADSWFGADFTNRNIQTIVTLTNGTFDLAISATFDCEGFSCTGTETTSFDWVMNIYAAPEPGIIWSAVPAFLALLGVRKRRKRLYRSVAS